MGEMVSSLIAQKCNIPIPLRDNLKSELNPIWKLQNILNPFIGNELEKEKLKKYLQVSQFMMQEENLANCVIKFTGVRDIAKDNFIKAIRESYFPLLEAYLEIDLSTYQEKHMISKLIGAPPGYVGSQDSGILVDKLKNFPRFLLVIRNETSAHPHIVDFLKKVIQGSTITDIYGNNVCMRNAIVILDQCTNDDLTESYSELDSLSFGTITFRKLTHEELSRSAKGYLQVIARNLKKQNIHLAYHASIQTWVKVCINKNDTEEALKRELCRSIIETISDALLCNLQSTKQVELFYNNEKLKYSYGGN